MVVMHRELDVLGNAQGVLQPDRLARQVRQRWRDRGERGNQILASARARMKASGIDGTIYSPPIGLNGHGAGPLIGLWDYQQGVPGRGDAPVIPSMWFSIELQATTPVAEWGGQRVRMAQEEDAIVDADGRIHWALQRQSELFLVR